MRLILHPMEQATLQARGAVRVRCLGGTLWITGDDGADRLLENGNTAELPARQVRCLSSVARYKAVDFELDVVPSRRPSRAAAVLRQLRQLL
ncbi:DUF2917 domain-containing protein [Massilia sp. METH4]|uniref:DUF2917 domain-containing protein n=1 Tax=Massilia sp. METH4 TaxID=3123041 RepID=UPI0030CB3011